MIYFTTYIATIIKSLCSKIYVGFNESETIKYIIYNIFYININIEDCLQVVINKTG